MIYMNKELTIINSLHFEENNLEEIKQFSNKVCRLTVDSILSNNVVTLQESFKSITENLEKVYNILELDSNSKNNKCYQMGRISFAIDILSELSKYEKSFESLCQISNDNKLIIPLLSILSKYNTVSGVQLREYLNLKSGSYLTNLLKRIKDFDLIEIRKIGTNNYYSLTQKGKNFFKFVSKNVEKNNESEISIHNLFLFFDDLTDELLLDDPSSVRVISKCKFNSITLNEKRLLKQKIDNLYYARNNYIKIRIRKSSINSDDLYFYVKERNEYYEEYSNEVYISY